MRFSVWFLMMAACPAFAEHGTVSTPPKVMSQEVYLMKLREAVRAGTPEKRRHAISELEKLSDNEFFEKEARKWVGLLGSDTFAEREEASLRLAELFHTKQGKQQLVEAEKNRDLEVRRRAKEIKEFFDPKSRVEDYDDFLKRIALPASQPVPDPLEAFFASMSEEEKKEFNKKLRKDALGTVKALSSEIEKMGFPPVRMILVSDGARWQGAALEFRAGEKGKMGRILFLGGSPPSYQEQIGSREITTIKETAKFRDLEIPIRHSLPTGLGGLEGKRLTFYGPPTGNLFINKTNSPEDLAMFDIMLGATQVTSVLMKEQDRRLGTKVSTGKEKIEIIELGK